jgi:hypothetical protein
MLLIGFSDFPLIVMPGRHRVRKTMLQNNNLRSVYTNGEWFERRN